MNTHMCAQVKVQRKTLATALKCALRTRETELTLLRALAHLTHTLISFINSRHLRRQWQVWAKFTF